MEVHSAHKIPNTHLRASNPRAYFVVGVIRYSLPCFETLKRAGNGKERPDPVGVFRAPGAFRSSVFEESGGRQRDGRR